MSGVERSAVRRRLFFKYQNQSDFEYYFDIFNNMKGRMLKLNFGKIISLTKTFDCFFFVYLTGKQIYTCILNFIQQVKEL